MPDDPKGGESTSRTHSRNDELWSSIVRFHEIVSPRLSSGGVVCGQRRPLTSWRVTNWELATRASPSFTTTCLNGFCRSPDSNLSR